MKEHTFTRTELLIGKEGLENLKNSKVVVFGIGGVGSFTTEALTRSGVGNLTLIDNDTVSLSNLNRQIHANLKTVSRPKVEIMKERILDINPECNVTIHETFVTKDNLHEIIKDDVDYVVDAIDTVTSKIAIIEYCKNNNINVISSMGTGNKMDPTKFKVTTLDKTSVCPLAKVMRYELKKRGIKKVKVLFSDELPMKPIIPDCVSEEIENNNEVNQDKVTIKKRQTPGSIAFVPPVAGMIIAGEVVKDILKNC